LALDNSAAAKKFFETLSDSVQRHHVDNITSAKAPATRQRRIAARCRPLPRGKGAVAASAASRTA
jgi:uncharacterized protein YdeI (YjbR/CyaY-like superfamily)